MAKRKTVLACGTFDLLHLGHLHFFAQARKFGRRLTVLVARDRNVVKAKGRKTFFSERERAELLRALRVVDRVVLGDARDFLKGVLKVKPDVLVLGFDQFESAGRMLGFAKKPGVKDVQRKLLQLGLKTRVVRLKRGRAPERFKSSKVKAFLKVK